MCSSPGINPSFGSFLLQENRQNKLRYLQNCYFLCIFYHFFSNFHFFLLTRAERTFETGYGGLCLSSSMLSHREIGPQSLRFSELTLGTLFLAGPKFLKNRLTQVKDNTRHTRLVGDPGGVCRP